MASRFPPAAAGVLMASGIFLTGGNQLRLAMVVGGTAMGRALTEAYLRGAVVAGTSAGASALAEHMVSFGRPGETPRQRMGQLAGGLGLLPGVVVDQHFGQRNRIGRLLAMVAQSPALLGVGVDEDTAAVIGGDGVLEVIGRGAVTVVDGSNVVSDAYEVRQHRPVLVSGAVLHALPPGYRFDLTERKLLPRLTAIEEGPRRPPRSPRRLAQAIAAEGAQDRAAAAAEKQRQAERGELGPARPDLRILETRVYRGPNYWSYEKAVHLLVDLGSLEERPSNTLPGLVDELLRLLPGVAEHTCSTGRRGGFAERLREGTWLGHVAEHVALPLH